MTDKKRLMITIDDETVAAIDKLKKEKFYDKPFSEMYRYLIQLGLEQTKGDK